MLPLVQIGHAYIGSVDVARILGLKSVVRLELLCHSLQDLL